MIKIGMDIGSTTLKCVVTDENNNLIYKDYKRHYSKTAQSAAEMTERIISIVGGRDCECIAAISGSAGMGIAQDLGIPFVQEVYAERKAVKEYIPDTDAVIELGGEDAKILFLGENEEVRMNGSCAGGTGAFIDQMATLLNITPDEMNTLAKHAERTYTIASRCGVFAKSDIQPLINQGAAKSDICKSIFGAVVNQTAAGLAQGRVLEGKIVYLGGPLTFLSELRNTFDEVLQTEGICPENSLFYVASGAILTGTGTKISLFELKDRLEKYKGNGNYKYRIPLFNNEEEYKEFRQRHDKAVIPVDCKVKDGDTEFALGIDAGSTTVKLVVTDREENIIYSQYQSNTGDPVDIVCASLRDFYNKFPDAKIISSCVTGYGEDIIKNAFSLDYGIVETQAHFTAAKKFDPKVDFIIDIGGQDIKCFKIRNGVIDNIFLNEACSSGCGSFLQTFAGALGYNIADFAKLGLFAKKPVDLGSRCTIFMNSSVKQAQKDGASLESISAGLSVSVVKNALYKVIRASGPSDLGERIVVQGGTFLNDAVLRAFEQELGTNVTRPGTAGIMGAYGAALYALRRRPEHSCTISREELSNFTHTSSTVICKGCTNACRLAITSFNGKRKFISGNKCERPVSSGKVSNKEKYNMFEFKRKLLASYKPRENRRGIIGLPFGLNFYENLPFWHTFFTQLGFKVIVSPESTRKLYTDGQTTIPSDTVCYPAKLMHGHINALINMGADCIFYPCMSYNFDEGLSENHFNCPVVAYYPEVINANMHIPHDIKFIYDYIDLSDEKLFDRKIKKILDRNFPDISSGEIKKASKSAYAEYAAYRNKIELEGERILKTAKEKNLPIIVLCGRPYHIDPEISHGIDNLICSMGAAVITEDALLNKFHRSSVSVLNQWTYHARLYAAADYICENAEYKNMNLIQLVSFGCGIDAITTDELRSKLESEGKIYTQIKIDEITNLGAVKIRLRSLFAALENAKDSEENKK